MKIFVDAVSYEKFLSRRLTLAEKAKYLIKNQIIPSYSVIESLPYSKGLWPSSYEYATCSNLVSFNEMEKMKAPFARSLGNF